MTKRRSLHRYLTRWVIVACCLAPLDAEAFELDVHEDISRRALNRMASATLDIVVAANLHSDQPQHKQDARHFNDCAFEAAAAYVRAQYEELISAVTRAARSRTPPGEELALQLAARHLGRLLHAVQDFYAHSNWVQHERAQLAFSSFDQPFPELSGGSCLAGRALVADGSASTAADAPGRNSCPPNAFWLVSGIVGASIRCPRRLRHGHWDWYAAGPAGLHQDDPSRPFFRAARLAALRQTSLELRRLEWRLASIGLLDFVRKRWSAGVALAGALDHEQGSLREGTTPDAPNDAAAPGLFNLEAVRAGLALGGAYPASRRFVPSVGLELAYPALVGVSLNWDAPRRASLEVRHAWSGDGLNGWLLGLGLRSSRHLAGVERIHATTGWTATPLGAFLGRALLTTRVEVSVGMSPFALPLSAEGRLALGFLL